jgi:6-phosphogluconolactonase
VIYKVYITTAGDDAILVYDLDLETGELWQEQKVTAQSAPGPLALHPTQEYMYVGLRGSNEVGTLSLDPASGYLALVDRTELRADPCYISVDKTGRYLLGAYYGAGMASVHQILETGDVAVQPARYIATYQGAHCIYTNAANSIAYLPHVMPVNRIVRFDFDAMSGTLNEIESPAIKVPQGAGPRHYVYHPSMNRVYFSNEQGSSVTVYELNTRSGHLTPMHTISTLPSSYEGENTCAQVHIHPSGRYLYVSNRGHDSIAVFAVDEEDGGLAGVQLQSTEPTPRAFDVDPTGQYCFVTGQGSNQLTTYAIDVDSGRLSPLESYPLGERPMWVLAIELPGEELRQ